MLARFTTVEATGLWPVHIVAASHTPGTAHRAVATAVAAASDLPAGSAKGSLTYDAATAELKFAAAFVDQKDERKPIVSATGFDQLYATFTTAVRSASDKPEQTDQLPIEEIN
jgi:hypothetical protein